MIEFALVASLMFLVFWGIFEFGRDFYVRNTTQHLTRCMARSAVVHKPSQYLAAKQECLMGTEHSWPFFYLGGGDLSDKFHLEYLLSPMPGPQPCAAGCKTEADVSSGIYDQQALDCVNNANGRCIFYVRAYYAGGPVVTFGLLAAWMGADGALAEPPAATTMRAENMGWVP